MRLLSTIIRSSLLCGAALLTARAALPAGLDAPKSLPPDSVRASTKLRPGVVVKQDRHQDGTGAALVIEGDNITVDFNGLVLRGTPATVEPDARAGTGILVRGKNITIKNARVHGYKIGLYAKNAPGLKILDSDFSYNWKQRLRSTQEREDLSDWMSFHQNEKNEWLRFGAGIYLDTCDGFLVRGTRITSGQCGLMLTRSNRGRAYNNDFSFLSGIGVGLYRSSGNQILHNRIDWCVRGYSHGVYNRGQDSAGILVYEQSSKNIFAYNSVTHGGDGFFLWAGQTTMDTGTGGCNDNLVYANDFSHAPTNGIEATFSRNRFVNNLVLECWHGIWGGYSYDTLIRDNIFGLNAQAIAIEHGQNNTIQGNTFSRDNTAIRLWQNPSQDPNWGYPKNHDTRSHGYQIADNRFRDLPTALDIRDTADVTITDSNTFAHVTRLLATQGDTSGLALSPALQNLPQEPSPLPATMTPNGNTLLEVDPETRHYLTRFATGWNPLQARRPLAKTASILPPLPEGKNQFLRPGALRGRRYILVDEWGPYDFRRPLLWPRSRGKADTPGVQHFEILGPAGKWRVKSLAPGITLSATKGTVPGAVTATLPDKLQSLRIELEYVGGQTVDYRGIVTPARRPVAFGYTRSQLSIDWRVRWYRWEKDASDPRTQPEAFAALLKAAPIKEEKRAGTLDYDWPGALGEGLPSNYFATVAEGTFEAPAGTYTLEVTTDDGCRVFLDGKPVIADAWKYQGPTPYTRNLTLSAGPHRLRVEHFEIDGYATLQVRLRRKTGSR